MSDYEMTPEASYQRAIDTYQRKVETLEAKLKAAEAREERRARAAQLEHDEREAVISSLTATVTELQQQVQANTSAHKKLAEIREKQLEEARMYTGPRCTNDLCEDYDGAHPFHRNAAEIMWDRVQDNYRGALSDMPAVVEWREKLKEAEMRGEQRDRLAQMLEGITHEFERTIQEVDRPKGGMQVAFHGDFASAIRLPSVISRMRWWAREMRACLDENDKRPAQDDSEQA